MSVKFDSIYPDFLRTGLGKLNQLDARRELLALFSALEHFRRDLHAQGTTTGILEATHRYVSGLNLFNTMGFWQVNPADFSFELALTGADSERKPLQQIIEGQIRAGRFAHALRQGAPVFFQFGPAEQQQRGVLHSLSLSSQVVGMFCGVLQAEVAPAQEIAFSLLSLLLGGSADALATLRKTKELTQQVEALHELLPLCAWCKKFRNDSGYWEQIEKYISVHASGTAITHGICPDCQQNFLKTSVAAPLTRSA
jgi:hypothetical protein